MMIRLLPYNLEDSFAQLLKLIEPKQDSDPFARRTRSKGEKARNRKNRGSRP
jgi:hypothetical protein